MSTLWFPSPCCASARTAPGPSLGITKTPDYLDYCAVLQGDEVRWLLTRGTDGIYLIYDTQGHEIGRNERPAGLEAFFPLCMLDDGRLLMVVGYDWSTTARPGTL